MKLTSGIGLLLGWVLFISGCALETLDGHAPSEESANFPALFFSAASPEDAQLKALFSVAQCSSASCPAPIGVVVTATGSDVGLCSSFMIDDDLVATNAHCIPKDLREEGADCYGRIFTSFYAAHGRPAEVIGCERVLYASYKDEQKGSEMFRHSIDPDFVHRQLMKLGPDLAIYKLVTSAGRGKLDVTSEGFSRDDTVELLKFNPIIDANHVGGRLEPAQCFVSETHTEEGATTVGVTGCSVIPGNSGSVALVGGKARGITYARNLTLPYVYLTDFSNAPRSPLTRFLSKPGEAL